MTVLQYKTLVEGSVGIMPSDTLYGVVCRAVDKVAVARLYKLKSRENKPGTVIAASVDQLVELGLKRRNLAAVADFWPGAISIVVPSDNPSLAYLDQGVGSLAVRVVDDTELIEILLQTGPLLTTSANQPGEPAANTIAEARAYFGDTVDFYEDGGDLSGRKPSTLIRIVDDAIEVLREGAVEVNRG